MRVVLLIFFLLNVQLFAASQSNRPYILIPAPSYGIMESLQFRNKIEIKSPNIKLQSLRTGKSYGTEHLGTIFLLFSNSNVQQLPELDDFENYITQFNLSGTEQDTSLLLMLSVDYDTGYYHYKLIKSFVRNYKDSVHFNLRYPLNTNLFSVKCEAQVSFKNVTKNFLFKPYFNSHSVTINTWKDEDHQSMSSDIDSMLLDSYYKNTSSEFSVGLVLSRKWIQDEIDRGSFEFTYDRNKIIKILSLNLQEKDDTLVEVSGRLKETSQQFEFFFSVNFLRENMLFKYINIVPNLTGLSTQQAIQAQALSGTVKNLLTQRGSGKVLRFFEKTDLFRIVLDQSILDFRLEQNSSMYFKEHLFIMAKILTR